MECTNETLVHLRVCHTRDIDVFVMALVRFVLKSIPHQVALTVHVMDHIDSPPPPRNCTADQVVRFGGVAGQCRVHTKGQGQRYPSHSLELRILVSDTG